MLSKSTSVIVVGDIATDIIASGVSRIVGPGEATQGKELRISAGGKAVNISRMIAELTDNKTVAIIGKNTNDPFNLWKVPIDALKKSGVNVDYVQTVQFEKTKKFAHTTLIAVDEQGQHQIYGLRGINDEFSAKDIDNASELFEDDSKTIKFLVLSLVMPIATAIHAIKKANMHNIKVFIDPGGTRDGRDYKELLKQNIFLIKPNEHEVNRLTGIVVKDFESAKKAAQVLLKSNIKNVFITHGKNGGYLFNSDVELHIPVPVVESSGEKDETGCGDQALAAICASLLKSDDIIKACKTGLLAGTLQFGKSGIGPVTKEELAE